MQTNDEFLARIEAQSDPIIQKAQRRMLRAARAVLEATDQLRWAAEELERHPDYIRTERARRNGKPAKASLTPAWWLRASIESVVDDAQLNEASDWLFMDSDPRATLRNLRLFVETEARDLARQARRPARSKAAPAPGLALAPQAA